MADPETDRRDVNEAEEAFRRLVVASRDTPGVLELVEATFDQIPQAIQLMMLHPTQELEPPANPERFSERSTPIRFLRDLRIGITGRTLRASMPSQILSAS